MCDPRVLVKSNMWLWVAFDFIGRDFGRSMHPQIDRRSSNYRSGLRQLQLVYAPSMIMPN